MICENCLYYKYKKYKNNTEFKFCYSYDRLIEEIEGFNEKKCEKYKEKKANEKKCQFCKHAIERIYYSGTALFCEKEKKFCNEINKDICEFHEIYYICYNCKYYCVKRDKEKGIIDFCLKNDKETEYNDTCKSFKKFTE